MPRFASRERKHKKIAGAKDVPDTNTNDDTIIAETQTEREARRHALQQELRAAQPESRVSSKKRKRRDKYVETKLRKEENAELVRKLEGQKVDTSLLRSSRKLGRVSKSKRERLQRALREREAGVGRDGEEEVLFERRREAVVDEHEKSAEDVEEHAMKSDSGSGLKRPLEMNKSGQPIIRRRKRRGKTPAIAVPQNGTDDEESASEQMNGHVSPAVADDAADDTEEEEEWAGFGSDTDQEDDADLQSSDIAQSDSDTEPYAQSTDDETSSELALQDSKPARVSAFKAWADSQRNAAIGFTPSAVPTSDFTGTATFKPRMPSPDPMLDSIPLAATTSSLATSTKPAFAISIPRSESIQSARLELPVVQEEQKIIEAINDHPVVVVCGATGSGKTTQVPQMLFENGYSSHIGSTSLTSSSEPSKGIIGITQPRRVAATSVAARVKHEVGPEFGKKVAHQVRYDSSVSRDTAIKFMTDGILLREIQQDFILSKYAVIVLDEAHERSLNTDLLIAFLARIVPLRAELSREAPDKYYPLKLIIMSATLSHGVDSFLQNEKLWKPLGGPPPVVEAEGRQFPVTVHFTRKTRRDYVDETVEKVTRGHRKLPAGGMLVFLTGQQEIQAVAKRLRQKIGGGGIFETAQARGSDRFAADQDDVEDADGETNGKHDFLEGEEDHPSDADSEAEIKLDDEKDAEFVIEDPDPPIHQHTGIKAPLKPHILPLYAALPAQQQLRVFQPPPEGTRLIVLATDVAETSLTILGIRYVFDSGRVKEKKYDTSTGVQTFEVDWISKASAEQRKGRAGRTGPGHVWRLYSSAVYEEFFAEETVPEILRTPLEGTVLQLKAVEVENVVNFPFPTQPGIDMLEKAEELLKNLGAIEGGAITKLGREIMNFPLSPRFGKILLLAQRNGVLSHAVALIAALAVGDLFIPEAQGADTAAAVDSLLDDEDGSDEYNDRIRNQAETAAKLAAEKQHQAYTRAQATLSRWDDHSDAIKLLTAVAAHAEAQTNSNATAFCKDFWLREKGMVEVQMLRRQLHSIATSTKHAGHVASSFQEKLPLPTETETKMLNQVVAAGFVDQVAIRADVLPQNTTGIGFGRKPRRAVEVAYRTLFPLTEETLDRNMGPEEQELHRSVFVHPSSALAKLSPKEMPAYIVYSHLSRAALSAITVEPAQPSTKGKKTRMHSLTSITPKALAALAEGTPLLQIGKPIGKIEELPRSKEGAQRRQCWIGVGVKATRGGDVEWPLGAWKVVQRRGSAGRDWEVENVLAR